MSSVNDVTVSISNAARIGCHKLSAIALVTLALAACTQAPLGNKFGFVGAIHQASLQGSTHTAVSGSGYRAPEKRTLQASGTAYGLASFYGDESRSRTASGEKYDSHELTAAHPTLPFGTRLRVTNITNGRSVIVRVNDRGPFVPGRVVDVSNSAAEMLGMTGSGIAKVKINVVQ